MTFCSGKPESQQEIDRVYQNKSCWLSWFIPVKKRSSHDDCSCTFLERDGMAVEEVLTRSPHLATEISEEDCQYFRSGKVNVVHPYMGQHHWSKRKKNPFKEIFNVTQKGTLWHKDYFENKNKHDETKDIVWDVARILFCCAACRSRSINKLVKGDLLKNQQEHNEICYNFRENYPEVKWKNPLLQLKNACFMSLYNLFQNGDVWYIMPDDKQIINNWEFFLQVVQGSLRTIASGDICFMKNLILENS